MDRNNRLRCAAFMVVFMMLVSAAIALLGNPQATEDESVARTNVALDIDEFKIDNASYVSNQYTKIISAGEPVAFKLNLSTASLFDYSDLNMTWTLETDWNTTAYVTGNTIVWYYYFEADRWINVTVTEKADSSNSLMIPITVQVIVDLDGDGLPDTWERKYFPTAAMTDGTGDADADGWTDLEEFQNGTDPTVPNPKPGFIETYSWLIAIIAIVIVVIVMVVFVVLPKTKSKREEDEKKKIAAAVEVEKSLLGLDELEEKPKK